MMAARKSRSAFQLLSRGPLAAPTLLQGAAFFIDCQALYRLKCLSTQNTGTGPIFRLSGRETVPENQYGIGRNPLAAVTPASYDLCKTWLPSKPGSCPMRPLLILGTTVLSAALASTAFAQAPGPQPHNVVLFVADGLRFRMVDDTTAPTMAAIARDGVSLRNGHALFPTFTTANASGMATGHMLGDTGDFSNTIYAGFPVPGAGNTLTPFLENDVGARRHRRAFCRQLSRRGDDPETRPRQGLQHRVDRQDRPGIDLRSDGTLGRANDPGRRRHRHTEGHSAVRRNRRNGSRRRTCRS